MEILINQNLNTNFNINPNTDRIVIPTINRSQNTNITYQDPNNKINKIKFLTAAATNPDLNHIKYLINELKCSIELIDEFGNNCLLCACAGNVNIEIIKYFIDDLKMNINFRNFNGQNCLLNACSNNKNLEIIKYLIDNIGLKPDVTDFLGNNCLLAASNNENLEVMKYLITNHKMISDHMNYRKENCLIIACSKNKNINVIKYILNDLKINKNSMDTDNNNCLIAACRNNTNLDIIKFLIHDFNIDPRYKNENGNNALLSACAGNCNLDIIKYLIHEVKMDISILNSKKSNCLLIASTTNTNIEVIKYLIEEIKIDIHYRNIHNDDCLLLACWVNPNPEIIKYFIEELHLDVHFKNSLGENSLIAACLENKNIELFKYLFKICDIHSVTFRGLRDFIKNYLVDSGYVYFLDQEDYVTNISRIIKEMAFTERNVDKLIEYIISKGLEGNLFKKECLQKIEYSKLLVLAKHNVVIGYMDEIKPVVSEYGDGDLDFINGIFVEKENCLIFEVNDVKYYGYAGLVYKNSDVLRKMRGSGMGVGHLRISIPEISEQTVKLYLSLYYNGSKDTILRVLNMDQLIEVSYFVNLYPLNSFNIYDMEYYLCCKYDIDKHKLYTHYLKNLCELYELRRLATVVWGRFNIVGFGLARKLYF